MRNPYTQLYLHCVWATWNRLPLLTDHIQEQVYAAILDKCVRLGCQPFAVGGVADHVHLLVRFPTTLAVATLVAEVKGASSHLFTHVLQPDDFFKWQGAYGAFTVQKDGVPAVRDYIKNQKAHHAEHRLIPAWEHWDSPEPPDA